MTTTQTLDQAAAAKRAAKRAAKGAAMTGLLLIAGGVGAGLLVGLSLVHLLGWIGLQVDSGTGRLLHGALLP